MSECSIVTPLSSIDEKRIESSIDEIIRIYSTYGSGDYIGESITQTEHGLQCAALASAAKAPPAVIIGALCHDIGHLVGMENGAERMAEFGIVNHEGVGGELLKKLGFPELTCNIVARHVDAKRYQCAINSSYFDKLSDASKKTLSYQGGPMSDNEIKAFECDPIKRWILLARSWDEKAKVKDLKVAGLESYRGMMRDILTTHLYNPSKNAMAS